MPNVLQVTQLFGSVVAETLKKVHGAGFCYFTSRTSDYEIAKGNFEKLQDREAHRIGTPESCQLSKDEQHLMRTWAAQHGSAIAQSTIRSQYCNYKPGTLPINIYGNNKAHSTAEPIELHLPEEILQSNPEANNESGAPVATGASTYL